MHSNIQYVVDASFVKALLFLFRQDNKYPLPLQTRAELKGKRYCISVCSQEFSPDGEEDECEAANKSDARV